MEEYSQSQGMARRPVAKKKLNRNSMTVATKPAACPPSQIVPAKTAIQQPWPMTANIMSLRRPRLEKISIMSGLRHGSTYRSIVQIGTREEKKYAIPLKPANSNAVWWDIPTDCSKMTVAY